MTKPYQRWIRFLYGPFFIVIGFFYRIYKSNRGRVESLITGLSNQFFGFGVPPGHVTAAARSPGGKEVEHQFAALKIAD